MTKFKDYRYERPDLFKVMEEFDSLLEKFNSAKTFEEQNKAMQRINDLRNSIDTMEALVSIRHSINTEDEFYVKENDFFDENSPKFKNLVSKYYKELINSKFREELKSMKAASNKIHVVNKLLEIALISKTEWKDIKQKIRSLAKELYGDDPMYIAELSYQIDNVCMQEKINGSF